MLPEQNHCIKHMYTHTHYDCWFMLVQTCSISSSSWLLFWRILSSRFCFSNWNTQRHIHRELKLNMWMPVFGSTPCACFSMFSTCTHMLRSLKIKAYSGRWTAVCALEIAELCKTLCLYIINSRESASSPLLLFALFCSTACCKDSPSLIAIISDVTPSDAFRWLFKHPHTNTQHEHKCYTALPKLPESRNLSKSWI